MKAIFTKITVVTLFITATLLLSNCGKPVDSIVKGTWTQETFQHDSVKTPEIWTFSDSGLLIENVSNQKNRNVTGNYTLSSKGLKSFLQITEFGSGMDGKYLIEKFGGKRLVILRIEKDPDHVGEGEPITAGAYIRKELYK